MANESKAAEASRRKSRPEMQCMDACKLYTGVRRGGGGAAAAEIGELRADGGEEGGGLVQRPGQLLLVPRQQPAVGLLHARASRVVISTCNNKQELARQD
jgi:hypothetical protein